MGGRRRRTAGLFGVSVGAIDEVFIGVISSSGREEGERVREMGVCVICQCIKNGPELVPPLVLLLYEQLPRVALTVVAEVREIPMS